AGRRLRRAQRLDACAPQTRDDHASRAAGRGREVSALSIGRGLVLLARGREHRPPDLGKRSCEPPPGGLRPPTSPQGGEVKELPPRATEVAGPHTAALGRRPPHRVGRGKSFPLGLQKLRGPPPGRRPPPPPPAGGGEN